jgi:hypothetical protein
MFDSTRLCVFASAEPDANTDRPEVDVFPDPPPAPPPRPRWDAVHGHVCTLDLAIVIEPTGRVTLELSRQRGRVLVEELLPHESAALVPFAHPRHELVLLHQVLQRMLDRFDVPEVLFGKVDGPVVRLVDGEVDACMTFGQPIPNPVPPELAPDLFEAVQVFIEVPNRSPLAS